MTNEEAIKKIDDVLSSDYHYDETLGYQLTSDDFEWLEEAKKALEKQIPKKPIINRRRIQCINGHNQPIQHYKYCPMCGQLMDWSDT